MPKVILVRLIPAPTEYKLQSVPTSCLLDRKTNQIYLLEERKEVSKVVAQNTGKAELSYYQNLMYSKTKAQWFHIDLTLAKLI
ncbi:hypothetical protein ACTXT7_009183 [Hymenolepis weldensis]